MATFNAYSSTVSIDFDAGGFWGLAPAITVSGMPLQGATFYQETLSNGFKATAYGTGFTYSGLSKPTAGTITTIQLLDTTNSLVYSISDISVSFEYLNGAMNSGANWANVLNTLLAGSDDMWTGSANDVAYGFAGDDYISGNIGDDTLHGNDGNDTIYGDSGNDILDGGAGINYLSGDAGDDFYVIRNRTDEIGESGGTDGGIIHVDFYKASSVVENWTWADGVQKLPYWIDALLPDDATMTMALLGEDKTFTYNFPASAPAYFEGADSYNFLTFNEQQKSFVRQAFDYISSVIDVTFVEDTDPYAANSITFSNNYQSDSAGYAYLPSMSEWGSDVFLDYSPGSEYNLAPSEGDYSALVLIHEIGHALGMRHPFEATPNLPAGEDQTQWSVMSYNQNPSDYYLQYSALDIATLQYLYGPSTLQVNDDTYVLSSTAPNFIWDGAGTDTIDGSLLTQALTLYLDAGYWSHVGVKSTLISDAGQVTINIGSVIENAKGGSGNDSITGNSANNQLWGMSGNDVLQGDAGNDAVAGGNGNDYLAGGAGTDTLDGGAGTDVADYRDVVAAVNVNLGTGITANDGEGGTDTLIAIENIIGGAGNDTLTGDALANRLEGRNGNDNLVGGDGSDTLVGGAGTDTLNGGLGTDIADYTALAVAINVNLATGIASADGSGATDTLIGIDNILGGTGNDTLTGDANGNRLEGRNGNDSLVGGAGNDTFLGGNGADTMDGGIGTDFLDYSTATAAVTANLATGTTSNDGTGAIDTFTGMEYLIGGSAGDFLTGDAANNRIEGRNGNDSLVGADGSDTLTGDAGNDTLDGGNAADTLIGGAGADVMDGGAGIDVLDYRLQTGGVNANLLTGTASNDGSGSIDTLANFENMIGGTGSDTLTGDAGNNRIEGLSGNDNIDGGDGADTLIGGLGADTINGGNGVDMLDYTSTGTSVTVNLLAGTASDGSGTDTVLNVENINGGSGADTLIGDAGNNRIDGSFGSDSLSGGDGNDTLIGGTGFDTLNGGNGIDLVDYTAMTGAVTVNLGTGTASDSTGGTDTLLNVEYVNGGAAGDTLIGNAANNRIEGRNGNDTITGAAGSDTLIGGAGNDVFRFVTTADGSDTLSDFTSGTDTIAVVAGNFGLTAGAAVTLLSGASTPTVSGAGAEFLYNTTSGALFFDRDGTGSTYAATQIATLAGSKTLVAADIQVVTT
ncbi:M10 family metallopeptidase C-terminal domain-containing protein [Janthinobacterium sp. 17J80-10]|uniref:M10 family metallopeptidase C-terminal domain-containing protein n=1 Tax=Janthinobacterium sp. 17J80-10 TaxID=2497863 RepID=UPI0010052C46|nr:M10 family metallopeptidase C-terminal domain-containing protein [Janthinobacterium sp. 17J80-10]QAU35555.1 matrixin family metalloprotease [Janthinobacterium sp. 17J80-10]